MIALMNYAVPLMILIGLMLSFKLKRIWPTVVMGVLALVYTVAQPTMLPKGTVAGPVIEMTQFVDKPIVDRSLKPMSDVERDAKRNAELKSIDASIENAIKENKQ